MSLLIRVGDLTCWLLTMAGSLKFGQLSYLDFSLHSSFLRLLDISQKESLVNRHTRSWSILSPSEPEINAIVAATGISRSIASAMANRGVSAEDAVPYLSPLSAALPNPFLLSGMDKAANRFADAIQSGEPLAVWGDYDVDGLSASACLCWFGRMLGVVGFRSYIPCRFSEGYGLNKEGICELAAEGIQLLVSVDCGITSLSEAKLCRDLGIDLIITDHHTPCEQIPDAVAVVDPLLPGDQFPYKKIAGVGVAYNLAVATLSVLKQRGWFGSDRCEPVIDPLLALVAIATVADVVELQNVNRYMVAKGLRIIREGMHPFEGIRSLCEVSGVSETTLTSGQIAFKLAARLNASGRLETAQTSLDLLMSTDQQEAGRIALRLDGLNAQRQEAELMVVELASKMFQEDTDLWERKTIVLAHKDFHPGVIGIASNRLVERFCRPTVLIAIDGDKAKGSCRSIKPFNIYNGLCSCAEHLLGFGGHPMAAGLSLSTDKIRDFADAFERSAAYLTDEDLNPVTQIDAVADADELTLDFCRELDRLEPFGMGNSRPTFCLRGCTAENVKILKEKHLKLTIAKGDRKFSAIGFSMTDYPQNGEFDVAFTADRNEWFGKVSLQLMIKGFAREG